MYEPFTWIRSVPTFNRESTPVTTMTVRIETGDRRFAGTDDDVYLRVSRSQRFSLDKALYDDFERGDNDTYSVPIGSATRDGLTVGDIDRVAIEKGRDGAAGGWFLHGVTLIVNGRVIVRNRRIDRWLEDSAHLGGARPGPRPPHRRRGRRLAPAARRRLREQRHRRHQPVRPPHVGADRLPARPAARSAGSPATTA